MAKKKKAKKKNPTRGKGTRGPKCGAFTDAEWEEFHKLASYRCTQKEIADFFDISVDTLSRRYEDKHGKKLADFYDKKKGHARAKLRKIQWDIAEQGSTAMAIFLGKHLLGQTDRPIDEEILETVQSLGLSKDEALRILTQNANMFRNTGEGKKTFTEFCEAAGYPAPFEKQCEMVNFGMNETDTRLLLGARGYGKTDYVVILGVAFDIYLNPLTSTNLIISKSKDRNTAMLEEIAKALQLNGISLEKNNSTTVKVAGLPGKDASVSAVTIKTTSLRGRHPKRIIMEDAVTEDDTSDATRNLVEKKYNEAQKLTNNVLVIGQPAHKYDLFAKLRKLVKKMEVPHGTIPELDHDIEAQRLAGVTEASIQASYFLKILPEGITPFDNVKYLDHFPTKESVAFIDPSHEGGDYTALSIITQHLQGIAVVGFVWRKAWNHCLDDMVPHFKKFQVKKIAFETNALGDMPIDILRQVVAKSKIEAGVIGRKSTNNKHSRIMAAGAYAHLIHLSKESDATYTDHVVQYEYKAKFDDAPDSLATGLEWIGLIRGKG